MARVKFYSRESGREEITGMKQITPSLGLKEECHQEGKSGRFPVSKNTCAQTQETHKPFKMCLGHDHITRTKLLKFT